jgi:hypothetical protein
MKDIIDLHGASGTKYRFRLWPPGAGHLPMGGNYAFVRETPGGGFVMLAAAAIDDLSLTRSMHGAAATALGATHLFTRLNVSRAIRTAEAEDIAAYYDLGADQARPAKRGG